MTSILEVLQAFPCTDCNQHFATFDARKRHVMRHRSKYLRWIKAKKRSSLRSSLRSVLAPYQCAVCNSSFVEIDLLKNHVKVDHILVTAYGCNICSSASFQDRDSYVHHVVHHVQTHKLKAPYQCVYCQQCCDNNSVLRNHVKGNHRDMILHVLRMKYALEPFQCGYCNKCFACDTKLQQHILNAHEIDRPYYCRFCWQCFTDFSSLYNHVQSMHTAKPYCCEFCHWKFPDFPALAHHVDQLHRAETYLCKVCKHAFSDYSSMARHVEQTHEHTQRPNARPNVPLAPYRCQFCKQAHYKVTDLFIHTRNVHGYKWTERSQDSAECLKKPVSIQVECESTGKGIVCPRKTSESNRTIRLARRRNATTNDRTAEPENCSLGMVSNANSMMDRCKAAKTGEGEEALLDLPCGAASQEMLLQAAQSLQVLQAQDTQMQALQPQVQAAAMQVYTQLQLHVQKLQEQLNKKEQQGNNIIQLQPVQQQQQPQQMQALQPQVQAAARQVYTQLGTQLQLHAQKLQEQLNKKEQQGNNIIQLQPVQQQQRHVVSQSNEVSFADKSPTMYNNVMKKQIPTEEIDEVVVVTVTEEIQSQSQILSKQMAATSPQQGHIKKRVGSQNGTVVLTKIAPSSTCTPQVVRPENITLQLFRAACKSRRSLLPKGRPRKCQPDLEEHDKQSTHNWREQNRRNQEKNSYLALREEVPALASKNRAAKVDILKCSTEYIHALRSEEEKLLKEKEMEKQRFVHLQERLHDKHNILPFRLENSQYSSSFLKNQCVGEKEREESPHSVKKVPYFRDTRCQVAKLSQRPRSDLSVLPKLTPCNSAQKTYTKSQGPRSDLSVLPKLTPCNSARNTYTQSQQPRSDLGVLPKLTPCPLGATQT